MAQTQNTEEYLISEDLEEEAQDGFWPKISRFLESRYFVGLVVVLVALVSFFLGRISGQEEKKPPVRIISSNSGEVLGATSDNSVNNSPPNPSLNLREGSSKPSNTNASGQVVASKNGTKYHYPWCAGAKQISEKNKITLNSIEEARAKGYTPAANCKGLK